MKHLSFATAVGYAIQSTFSIKVHVATMGIISEHVSTIDLPIIIRNRQNTLFLLLDTDIYSEDQLYRFHRDALELPGARIRFGEGMIDWEFLSLYL